MFMEKGFKNVPVRCEDCRKTKRAEASKIHGRARKRSYHTPLPEPTSTVKDSITMHRNGKIVYCSRGYGFIEYDNGQVHYPFTSFEGEMSLCRPGTIVDFVCCADGNGKITASRVIPTGTAAVSKRTSSNAIKKEKKPYNFASKSENTCEEYSTPKRDMIDIVVECDGKDSVIIQKPVQQATFQVFRRLVNSAFRREIKSNFRLLHNNEVLTYEAFNSLENNDVIVVEVFEENA